MKAVQLCIQNFRGIKSAVLDFDGHTLLLGVNNVGKSTICEALELVLGPDRLSKFPPVEEFDFYNARYLDRETSQTIPIQIDLVLTELSEEVANKCAGQTSFWDLKQRKVLEQGQIKQVDDPNVCECLRLRAVARYDLEDDQFQARTVFVDGPSKVNGEPQEVPQKIKRLFGFLYLRALRTGSRALSLERGSLLDVILRRQGIQTGIWENAIDRLRNLKPPIDEGAVHLTPILDNIEKRIAQYLRIETEGRATQLFVSQLTREHLRKTISFFLKSNAGQEPVPFQEAGTGTLNVLVLALLTFIGDIKKDNVIFAMEEPEIALPPHTQRRIVDYLLSSTSQSFVTSHSPYVIERFEPEQISVLRRDKDGVVAAAKLPGSAILKPATYRRHLRRAFAEAILARGVIVCEGLTELDLLRATSAIMEKHDPDTYYPLDLSGVTMMSVTGDGSLAEFGASFRAMAIESFAFYDDSKKAPEIQKILGCLRYSLQDEIQGQRIANC